MLPCRSFVRSSPSATGQGRVRSLRSPANAPLLRCKLPPFVNITSLVPPAPSWARRGFCSDKLSNSSFISATLAEASQSNNEKSTSSSSLLFKNPSTTDAILKSHSSNSPKSSYPLKAPLSANPPSKSWSGSVLNRKPPTVAEYASLIARAIRAEKYNVVFNLARELKDNQVKANLEIMNNLMRAYLASGLTFKVWKTFEEMEADNIAPNVFTLNFLVEASLYREDIDAALKAIDTMRTKYNLSPNAFTYNLFIIAYGRHGDLAKCFEQIEIMKNLKITPLLPTYEALLTACTKCKDSSRIAEVMEQVNELRFPPLSSSLILSLLKMTCVDDNITGASACLVAAHKAGMVLTQGTLLEMLNSAARKERYDFAEECWQLMKQLKYSPDILAWNALLYAYMNAKHIKKSLCVLHDIVDAGFNLHSPALEFFQRQLLSTIENMDAAYYDLETLAAEGRRILPAALNIIVRSCANAGDLDRAYATYAAFERFQLAPDIDTMNSIIEGCARTRQPAGAFRMYEQMIEKGVTPNVVTYELLVAACVSKTDIAGAVEIINNLPPDISPTYRMFALVARRCAQVGDIEKANIIVESMRAVGVEPDASLEQYIASEAKAIENKERGRLNRQFMTRNRS